MASSPFGKAGQSTAEIDAVIAHGGAPEMNALEIDTIYGFRFVFDHYKAIGAATERHPSTLRPIDATKAEIDAYLKAFHRPRKAAAKRQRYAARRADEAARREAAADLDRRTSAISTVLTDDKWRSIAELMAALEHNLAFRRPNGKKFLTGDSLSKAIRRQLAKPDLAALIEITKTEGARGQDKLRSAFSGFNFPGSATPFVRVRFQFGDTVCPVGHADKRMSAYKPAIYGHSFGSAIRCGFVAEHSNTYGQRHAARPAGLPSG